MISFTSVGHLVREVFYAFRREGSFSQNFLAVASGTGVNILIQVFVSPLLTRIYGPEGYGMYALFVALCTNIALIATLRLPQTFLIARNDREFSALVKLSVTAATITSALVFFIMYFSGEAILNLLQAKILLDYKYLIPLMVLLIAANAIIGQWQIRLNVFKKSVAIDTGVLAGVRVFNLVFGWLSNGMRIGLIFGDFLGKFFGILLSARLIIKRDLQRLGQKISVQELKSALHTYKSYPLFNLPGVWLMLTSEQLPLLFLSSAFGLSAIGLLSLAVSMLDLPKRLFAYSISSVFFKKAADLSDKSFNDLQSAVRRMFYTLLMVSVFPYSIVITFGPFLFATVFGSEWELSGRLAQYLAVYYALEFICIAFDPLFYTLRKEKQLFRFQLSAFVGRLIVLMVALHFFHSLELSIIALMLFNVVLYSVQLVVLFQNVRLPAFRYLAEVLLSLGGLTSVLCAAKWALVFVSR